MATASPDEQSNSTSASHSQPAAQSTTNPTLPTTPETQELQPRKQLPFTEEDIRSKAFELWKARNGTVGSAEGDWNAAIEALKKERSPRGRMLAPFRAAWRWTGFGEKKLWDLLQLLLVPLLLAGAGFALQEYGKQREQIAANEKGYQDTLTNYLDKMEGELNSGLLTSKPGDKTFIIAQARTITALQSLDPKRQQIVIQFLKAATLNNLPGNRGLLYNAQMSSANLPGSNLSSADLRKVNFANADLSGANLSEVNLSGANFIGASLSGANLFEVNLTGVHFDYSNLAGAILSGDYEKELDFSVETTYKGANLRGVSFKRAFLVGSFLKGADLTGVTLKDSHLNGADLSNANLKNADLRGADLGVGNFPGGFISGESLDNAGNIEALIFFRTPLLQTMEGVPLIGYPFVKAYVHIALLMGVHVEGACFKQAKNLTIQQVKSAKNWSDAYYSKDFRKQLGLPPDTRKPPQECPD